MAGTGAHRTTPVDADSGSWMVRRLGRDLVRTPESDRHAISGAAARYSVRQSVCVLPGHLSGRFLRRLARHRKSGDSATGPFRIGTGPIRAVRRAPGRCCLGLGTTSCFREPCPSRPGRAACPTRCSTAANARRCRLLITADAGGSNGYRVRARKKQLAALADETGLEITVKVSDKGLASYPSPATTSTGTGTTRSHRQLHNQTCGEP